VAWLAGGLRDAVPLLTVVAILLITVTILNAVAVMYQARQETRRREIDQRGPGLIAAALARCIDDTHAGAVGLSGMDAADEAARVRASAAQALTVLGSAVTTMLDNPGPPITEPQQP
jgi:CHASE1-domain containing sensor protein